MEKYGVDVDPKATKTASEEKTPKCPSCGSYLLNPGANVPSCPQCGTRPFETSK